MDVPAGLFSHSECRELKRDSPVNQSFGRESLLIYYRGEYFARVLHVGYYGKLKRAIGNRAMIYAIWGRRSILYRKEVKEIL
jgi:hypothetical protein